MSRTKTDLGYQTSVVYTPVVIPCTESRGGPGTTTDYTGVTPFLLPSLPSSFPRYLQPTGVNWRKVCIDNRVNCASTCERSRTCACTYVSVCCVCSGWCVDTSVFVVPYVVSFTVVSTVHSVCPRVHTRPRVCVFEIGM